MVFFRDGDELILFLQFLKGLLHEGIGFERMKNLPLLGGEVPCLWRELPVNAHIVGLQFLLLFQPFLLPVPRRVDAHLPLIRDERQLKSIVAHRVRHRVPYQALSLLVVEDGIQVHV